MKLLFPLTTVIFSGWIISCTPVPEGTPPTPPTDVAENRGADKDKPKEDLAPDGDEFSSGADEMKKKAEDERDKISENIEDPKPEAPKVKNTVPVARRVPGREGFVFSPYNNKMINVKDFSSGTMVADPTYPASEKKYFRVP